jgi:hypothetical protein
MADEQGPTIQTFLGKKTKKLQIFRRRGGVFGAPGG